MNLRISSRFLILLPILFVLPASDSFAQIKFTAPIPEENPSFEARGGVLGRNYQGFIQDCGNAGIAKGTCWKPSKNEVARLEKGLPKYVLSKIDAENFSGELPKYYREYSGFYIHGRKILAVFFHYGHGKWKRSKIQATPGVEVTAFSLNYDVQTGKFSDFREENLF